MCFDSVPSVITLSVRVQSSNECMWMLEINIDWIQLAIDFDSIALSIGTTGKHSLLIFAERCVVWSGPQILNCTRGELFTTQRMSRGVLREIDTDLLDFTLRSKGITGCTVLLWHLIYWKLGWQYQTLRSQNNFRMIS